jgi:hypothetical protein
MVEKSLFPLDTNDFIVMVLTFFASALGECAHACSLLQCSLTFSVHVNVRMHESTLTSVRQ